MIEGAARRLSSIKREFLRTYGGSSSMHEVVVCDPGMFAGRGGAEKVEGSAAPGCAAALETFAASNSIYYNSYRQRILDADCTVYEGDINRYWLGSIMQESSRAPFSPTWMMSAFLLSLEARAMGYGEAVDIGSGDGRIAYCARVLGMRAYSVEIDGDLAELQKEIIGKTGVDFDVVYADATVCDFAGMGLHRPVFFIGGLAQMGGSELASGIMDNISLDAHLKQNSGFVFAGTLSCKYAGSEHDAGWGDLIRERGLDKTKTIQLPTAWTAGEPDETQYVFARF